MAIRISTAARNAAANAIALLVDAGAAAGTIKIYTGAQPAGPGTAASGTLLATLTLSDPAFASASSGAIVLDVTPVPTDSAADATGTAGWFRIADSDANGIVDGSVTATGGGGDLTLNTVDLTAGVAVEITSFTLTMPAS